MKIVLYMAMTVNGFIAKENDQTPWSKAVWESYYRIAKKFKALVIGRRTYEIMKNVNEFGKIGNPFTIVITKRKIENHENFAFAESPQKALDLLEQKRFTEALLGGGGRVNGSFLEAGLVDEIYLDIEPMVFSKGVKLFEAGDFEAKLELIGSEKISKNVIQLRYRVLEDMKIKRKAALEKLKEFSRDSRITEEDALLMGRQVNKSLAKRYKKL